MSRAGEAKTGRRAQNSRLIEEAMRAALKDGPVSSTKMIDHFTIYWNLGYHSIRYHAVCAGVKFIGKNPRARVWMLPKE
jgi:hypothetical protein